MAPRPKTAAPTDDDLAAQLHAAGLRRTQPRIAVLRFMRKVRQPVAHAEVAEALEKLAALDRVSVYRVLIDLARANILTRADRGDHVWRFDLARGDGAHALEHPHFVCVRCGGVECLSEKAVQIAARGKAPRAVRAGRVEVQLKGECDVCASA
jgi:Fur family ferric uptake transcriptional regulator